MSNDLWPSDPGASGSVGDTLIETVEVDRTVPAKAPKRKANAWLEWFVVVFVAIGAALLVRAYVLQQFAVSGIGFGDPDVIGVAATAQQAADQAAGHVAAANEGNRDVFHCHLGVKGCVDQD